MEPPECEGQLNIRPQEWIEFGTITMGLDGKLQFPRPSSEPAIYRFRYMIDNIQNIYFGETENLRRRFDHYKNPGPSQKTNIRVNEILKKQAVSGVTVTVAIVTEATINIAKCSERITLVRRGLRILIEEDLQNEALIAGHNILNIRKG